MFFLISAWINGWVNNHEAGALGRHRAHYDVIVMMQAKTLIAYGFIQFSMLTGFIPHAFYTTHKNRHGYQDTTYILKSKRRSFNLYP